MSRRLLMLPVANAISDLLPGLGVPRFAIAGSQRTYAPWPVWRDSTTSKVKFMPLAKKQATKLYHKARAFERQTRQRGRQNGALGRNGLLVLHALIFDFLDYATGQLDPSIEAILAAPEGAQTRTVQGGGKEGLAACAGDPAIARGMGSAGRASADHA